MRRNDRTWWSGFDIRRAWPHECWTSCVEPTATDKSYPATKGELKAAPRVSTTFGPNYFWTKPSTVDSNVRQQAMRAAILVLFALGIAGANPAQAGLSASPREVSATADPADTAVLTDESDQQSEDQIGLSKTKRRDIQRRLTKLGFDTKATGKFDDQTRDAISRWQDQHSYPKTGFLNKAQHQALLTESTAAAEADKADRTERRRGGGHARHARGGIGGPIGAIGHVVGGLFGR